jgi:hypothetical protein
MSSALASINPFLAARVAPLAPRSQLQPQQQPEIERSVYAKLPRAPKTASPVPHLTSLYHNAEAGNYGSRSYPGNCGGNLIKDLLRYFRPDGMVFDPMSGSGTCRDVCAELGLPCIAWDIHQGFDACDPHDFPPKTRSPSSGRTRRTGGKSCIVWCWSLCGVRSLSLEI